MNRFGSEIKARFGGRAEPSSSPYTRPTNELFRYAYKGIVIEKKQGIARVIPPKLSGFDDERVRGVFTDNQSLGFCLLLALANASKERQAELRERYRNFLCPDCGLPTVIYKTDYEADRIRCPRCGQWGRFLDDFTPTSDELLR